MMPPARPSAINTPENNQVRNAFLLLRSFLERSISPNLRLTASKLLKAW